MYHTSVLRCFITSPDTPVCWILCVNYRFPCSLDRPIPTEIIKFKIFRIDSLNKKETEILSNCIGFRPSVVVMHTILTYGDRWTC